MAKYKLNKFTMNENVYVKIKSLKLKAGKKQKITDIDISTIDCVTIDRPLNCIIIVFKNGSTMMRTINGMTKNQFKILESFEVSEFDKRFFDNE